MEEPTFRFREFEASIERVVDQLEDLELWKRWELCKAHLFSMAIIESDEGEVDVDYLAWLWALFTISMLGGRVSPVFDSLAWELLNLSGEEVAKELEGAIELGIEAAGGLPIELFEADDDEEVGFEVLTGGSELPPQETLRSGVPKRPRYLRLVSPV